MPEPEYGYKGPGVAGPRPFRKTPNASSATELLVLLSAVSADWWHLVPPAAVVVASMEAQLTMALTVGEFVRVYVWHIPGKR